MNEACESGGVKTQMIITDQQVKHICKRYKYQPKEKTRKLEFQLLNISNVEKNGKAENAVSALASMDFMRDRTAIAIDRYDLKLAPLDALCGFF